MTVLRDTRDFLCVPMSRFKQAEFSVEQEGTGFTGRQASIAIFC